MDVTHMRRHRQRKLLNEIHGLFTSTPDHLPEKSIDRLLDLGLHALDVLGREEWSDHASVKKAQKLDRSQKEREREACGFSQTKKRRASIYLFTSASYAPEHPYPQT